MEKIISGKTAYVFKQTREWAKLGYRIVKQTDWSDGKLTVTMRNDVEGSPRTCKLVGVNR